MHVSPLEQPTLKVKEVSAEKFHDELDRKKHKYEFVLVYRPQANHKIKHTVYVVKYNEMKQLVTCMNSLGQTDPNPRIALKDILNLYKVSCQAVDAGPIKMSKISLGLIQ